MALTAIQLAFLLILPHPIMCLVGYDCSDPRVKVTRYSLLDLPTCESLEPSPAPDPVTIQLIQRKSFLTSSASSCLIEVTSTTYHCGMHSHISLHRQGISSRIIPISKADCERTVETLQYLYEGAHLIKGLSPNGTTSASFTRHGTIDASGGCSGESWTDGATGQSFSSAVQQVSVQISIKTFQALYATDKSGFTLPHGGLCQSGEHGCFDPTLGFTYFKDISPQQCTPQSFDVLYEGPANITTDRTSSPAHAQFLSVDSSKLQLALRLGVQTTVCHQLAYDTQYPDLFVLRPQAGQFYFTQAPVLAENVRLFTYINSKMATFERHLANQLTDLSSRVEGLFCVQEREQLKTLMTLARISPAEFAYQYKNQEAGVYAQTAGESVILIECPPVPVEYRRLPEICTDELPVTYQNTTAFLIPRSRIITYTPTVRGCSTLAPSLYKFDDIWVTTDGNLHRVSPPATLSYPDSQTGTWTYDYLTSWVKAGIYTQEDLKKFERRILAGQEMQGVQSYITENMLGGRPTVEKYDLSSLISEATSVSILKKGWNQFWSGLSVFGTYIASFLGVYWIFLVVKLVVNIALNVKLIHDVTGWSWALLLGLWGGLARIFVNRRNAYRMPSAPAEEEEVSHHRPLVDIHHRYPDKNHL